MAVDQDGRVISRNINRYLDHLKSHLVKTQAKKCTRCVLSFTHKGAMKVHLIYDHVSLKYKKLRPMCKSNTKIPKPKVNTAIKTFKVVGFSENDIVIVRKIGLQSYHYAFIIFVFLAQDYFPS